ncbi:hypothetical protein U5A85_14500, partial [Priestia megaterium]
QVIFEYLELFIYFYCKIKYNYPYKSNTLSVVKFTALLIRYKGENKMLFLSHDEKIKQLASHLAERLE